MRPFKTTLAICAVAALCSGGCAKHDLVKQEQNIPVTTSASSTKSAVAEQVVPEKGAGITDASKKASQAQQASAAVKAGTALQAGLEKIFFDFDSYTLSQQAREALAKNAEMLKKAADSKIRIEGNCDELGSDDYNLALGEKRADSALKYLQGLGVPAARLSAISYGKEKPAVAGHDEAARAKNRRDDFVVVSK